MLQDSRYYEGCELLELHRLDEADKLFRELLHEKPEHYEAINKIGVIFARKGKAQDAKICFEKALQFDGLYAPALVNLGNLELEAGDLKTAEVYFKKAIEADLDYPMSYYGLALISKKQGDLKQYVTRLKKSKRLERRARTDQDQQFRLQYKRKMGCLSSVIMSFMVVVVIAIALT